MSYHSIGQPGSPAVGFFSKNTDWTPFRRLLTDEVFSKIWSDPPHPNTVLIPSVVFWLMAVAGLERRHVVRCGPELLDVWLAPTVSPAIRHKSVTEEAFCIARATLPLKFFRGLFDMLVQRQEAAHAGRWLWHGKRLLGFDGTLVLTSC